MHSHRGRHTNQWQGFGKAKNRVGMARPKKKKVEIVDVAGESISEMMAETGDTGAEQRTNSSAPHAQAQACSLSARETKQLQEAVFEQEKAARIAASFRQEAREQEKQLELAKRLYNAKMRRLENGEKRKRGCCARLKRALRADNAVIAMREATIQCSLWQCRAAERKRDANAAEIRVLKLKDAILRRAT